MQHFRVQRRSGAGQGQGERRILRRERWMWLVMAALLGAATCSFSQDAKPVASGESDRSEKQGSETPHSGRASQSSEPSTRQEASAAGTASHLETRLSKIEGDVAQLMRQSMQRHDEVNDAILNGCLTGQLTVSIPGCPEPLLFAFIPAGTSVQGLDDEQFQQITRESGNALEGHNLVPAASIPVQRGFFIALHEISFAQITACPAIDPKLQQDRNESDDDGRRRAAVVSWEQSRVFCEWMSASSGYVIQLPTEVEWEHAARGPSALIGPENHRTVVARPETAGPDVPPMNNGWRNVRHMADGVAEWCLDYYERDHYATLKTNSRTPEPTGPHSVLRQGQVAGAGKSSTAPRVYRGGADFDPLFRRRFMVRRSENPTRVIEGVGFRPVLIPAVSPSQSGVEQ